MLDYTIDGAAGTVDQFKTEVGTSCCYSFFAKVGGYGKPPFDSLNVGFHVGDDPEVVKKNRAVIKEKIGAAHLLSALQVHGDKIYTRTDPMEEDLEVEGYDALITNVADVALMVQHADCQPVLLYDPVVGAIAAIHSGWRGSVQNIIGTVVETMGNAFGTDPANLQAVIGPSLGPCCAEFVNYKKELPESFRDYKDEKHYFDFWQISAMQLRVSGVMENNIRLPGACTACSDRYFSYRKAVRENGGITGRNGSVIVLHQKHMIKR